MCLYRCISINMYCWNMCINALKNNHSISALGITTFCHSHIVLLYTGYIDTFSYHFSIRKYLIKCDKTTKHFSLGDPSWVHQFTKSIHTIAVTFHLFHLGLSTSVWRQTFAKDISIKGWKTFSWVITEIWPTLWEINFRPWQSGSLINIQYIQYK